LSMTSDRLAAYVLTPRGDGRFRIGVAIRTSRDASCGDAAPVGGLGDADAATGDPFVLPSGGVLYFIDAPFERRARIMRGAGGPREVTGVAAPQLAPPAPAGLR